LGQEHLIPWLKLWFMGAVSTCGLSLRRSQVHVAFTVEFDNKFERRMGETGGIQAFVAFAVSGCSGSELALIVRLAI
jgi:hypothetical protein